VARVRPQSQDPNLTGGAPTLGTAGRPPNAQFSGPNADGILNDVPPQFGLGPAPLIAVNGVDTPKLGAGGGTSPKTHG
jgi:hypothetical protein